jgi:F-type H+-transporting ATPase subunit epsilon
MTGKEFNLEIVTPKRVVYNASVESFSAPGEVGGFQVLHNHAPLLSNIKIGAVKVIDAEGKETHYATSGGFVEVRNNKVVMLADTAERSDEIDVERAKASFARAQERISTKQGGIDIERARLSLLRGLNRLKVSGSQ